MDEVDLDSPVEPQAAEQGVPRLRRSAGLMAAGVAMLACQQVLGPMLSIRVFMNSPSADDAWGDAFMVVFVGFFAVGLALLVVGGSRFASHVHLLAERALRR